MSFTSFIFFDILHLFISKVLSNASHKEYDVCLTALEWLFVPTSICQSFHVDCSFQHQHSVHSISKMNTHICMYITGQKIQYLLMDSTKVGSSLIIGKYQNRSDEIN